RRPPVLTPLPPIPVHVIETPGIRRVTSHRGRPVQIGSSRVEDRSDRRVILVISVKIRHPRAEDRPKMKGTRCTRPTSVFPLRFGRQTIHVPGWQPRRIPFPRRQCQTVCHRIVPTDLLDGTTRIALIVTRITAHDREVFALCGL